MDVSVRLDTPVMKSARVLQVAGMFDVPLEQRLTHELDAALPIEDRPWTIGLITGPSGAGKSTLARQVWGDAVMAGFDWSPDKAIVDDFPAGLPMKDVVGLLTSVGLGSPPAWIRPHRTLSNGEAFRADMARALASTTDVTVIDEFTSVVDRQVARIVSHAVQKAVRKAKRQLVAVTCHYDVEDWLQPDWTFDVASGRFAWRSVQPHPPVRLEIHPVDRSVWPAFRRHHYLSGSLQGAAKCFGGFIDGELVAFSAYLHFPHPHTRNIKMDHRTVVLPDYQGLGISGRVVEWIGQTLYEQGYRYRRSVTHPAVIAYCARSPRWKENNPDGTRRLHVSRKSGMVARFADPRRLALRSFEYVPPAEGTAK